MSRSVIFAVTLLASGLLQNMLAQQVQGTLVGDDGKPLAATIHFLPSTGAGGSLTYATSTASGSFSVPSLAPGNYEVCIQVPGGGYANPCQWPSLKVSFTQSAASAVPLQLVAHKGSIVTVQLADPSGLLAATPTSHVVVGIFGPHGLFYPMLRNSKSASVSAYTLTIPYNTSAVLYISSPAFQTADSKGKALQSAGESYPLLQTSTVADPVFAFNVVSATGIKGN